MLREESSTFAVSDGKHHSDLPAQILHFCSLNNVVIMLLMAVTNIYSSSWHCCNDMECTRPGVSGRRWGAAVALSRISMANC
jgi:hypothetical protein